MQPDLLEGGSTGGARRRGRPPGSGNKRSTDLIRMIAAVYGSTPGEQVSRVGLVTPREVAAAKAYAKEKGLDQVVAALVIKARALGSAIGCTTAEAWDRLAQSRAELMPYVHQRRPQAVELEVSARKAPLVMIPEALGAVGPVIEGNLDEEREEDQGFGNLRPIEVSRSKSHGDG